MANDLIVKSNTLINASHYLTLAEQRLIGLAIMKLREVKISFSTDVMLEVRASDYMEIFGVDKTTAYQALKDAADKLFNRELEYEVFFVKGGENEISYITNIPPKTMGLEDWSQKLKTRWVSKSLYEPSRGLVFVTFTPEVLQYLTDLRAYFTQYYLSQTVELSSGYAFRLFEIVMQWKSVGKTPVISIDELRGRLGVEVGQYSEMHNFKKRVLDVAVEQVSKGEYTVTYKQYKAGRTITGFEFFFVENKKKEKPKSLDQKDPNTIDIFDNLTDKEREIVAQKNAYADQIGATAEHRENLIRQGLQTHRQAEQSEQNRKEREKAERLTQEQQDKERLELAQRQFEQILASDELINAYLANNNLNERTLQGIQRMYYQQGDFRGVFKSEKYKFEQLHSLRYLNLKFLD